MKELNLAEILKDCPKGMELDCTMFDNVTFDGISNGRTIVAIRRTVNHKLYLDKYGYPLEHPKEDLKCVIFPKGKTTWEGFVPPCKFKDGDILTTDLGSVFMLKETSETEYYYSCYIALNHVSRTLGVYTQFCAKKDCRLATEEEKQELFQAIKENGYKWNAETKTLDKLEVEKFDITTLVPFESRVLVRNSYSGFWLPAFWGIYETKKSNEHHYRNYLTTKGFFRHCIPYNDNTKHLLGTTDACDEYYKTWEE